MVEWFEPDMLAFSGCYYGGDEKEMKELDTIATKDELEPFSTFSSRMAVIDFIVCDESDVFVMNNNRNMAKILAGQRLNRKANINSDEVVTDQDTKNEPEASDQDEDDDLMGPQFLQSINETNVDDDPSISELPELEELLLD
ncbi:hypothetical protein Tco_0004526 [Tanacetum coccineum]